MGKYRPQGLEPAGRIGTKIHYREQVRSKAVLEMLGRVAVEQRHVEARVQQGLPQLAHIGGILPEETILIFHLDHQDGAAFGNLQRPEHAADLPEVALGRRHISRIASAKLDVLILEQPPWEAAHFPFGARVGPRAQDHPQALLLSDPAKLGGIRLA